MAENQEELIQKIIINTARIFPIEKQYVMKIEINELSVDVSIHKAYHNAIELTNIYKSLIGLFPGLKDQIVLICSELDNTVCLSTKRSFKWNHGQNCDCWCQDILEFRRNGGDLKEYGAQIIFNWYQPLLKTGNLPISVISFEFKDKKEILLFLKKLYQTIERI